MSEAIPSSVCFLTSRTWKSGAFENGQFPSRLALSERKAGAVRVHPAFLLWQLKGCYCSHKCCLRRVTFPFRGAGGMHAGLGFSSNEKVKRVLEEREPVQEPFTKSQFGPNTWTLRLRVNYSFCCHRDNSHSVRALRLSCDNILLLLKGYRSAAASFDFEANSAYHAYHSRRMWGSCLL